MTGAERPYQMRTRTTLATAELLCPSDSHLASLSAAVTPSSTGCAGAVPNHGKSQRPKKEQ